MSAKPDTATSSSNSAKKCGVINWPALKEQAQGDEPFLADLMQKFSVEMMDCSERIILAIEVENFNRIMKASHQLWGSAKYLLIEDLVSATYALQNLASEGTLIGEKEANGERKKWRDAEVRTADIILHDIRVKYKKVVQIIEMVKENIAKEHP
jgi:hypothetical protein